MGCIVYVAVLKFFWLEKWIIVRLYLDCSHVLSFL